MAAELSPRLGWISQPEVDRIERIDAAAGLPVRGPDLGLARYLELMSHDKKVEDGRLRLVLLKRIGEAVVEGGVNRAEIEAAIAARVDG